MKADEDVFVVSGDTAAPAYRGVYGENKIYTRDGVEVEIDAEAVEAWRTGDVVPTRCPHAPSMYTISLQALFIYLLVEVRVLK